MHSEEHASSTGTREPHCGSMHVLVIQVSKLQLPHAVKPYKAKGNERPVSDSFLALETSLHIWLDPQVHEISHLKLMVRAMLIRLRFHALLGAQQLLLQHGAKLLPIPYPFLQIWDRTCVQVWDTKVVRGRRGGGVAILYLKWRTTQCRVECDIVLELNSGLAVEPFGRRGMHCTS
jgi:hypothetical protein